MKKIFKVLGVIVGCIVVLLAVFLIYVQLTFKQKFEAPLTGIKSGTDSAMIARGKYLAMGPSHCYACHTPDSLRKQGLKEPMIGGVTYNTPFAIFNMPNITPDEETGIGRHSDEALARAIRYNVNHRDEAMVGFMAYNNMTDDDIAAIISYLRSTKPVRHQVPSHDYNMLGKVLMRFMVKPKLNVETSTLRPDTTAEYGRYLAFDVAQCYSCHTKRDAMGAFIGQPFAGGSAWELEDGTYTSPNLTPHDSTGRIAKWSEQVFIHRFRAGKVLANSPMPWDGYQLLSDNDLKALYKFLKSLPAERNEVTQTYVPKKANVLASAPQISR
jgi:mono/diheme cytochrome c family protein